MDKLKDGWIYFMNRGIIKSVKIPEFGELNLKVSNGVVTLIETKEQTKI
ncbi:hypothetical protein QM455_08870 [Streptococcus australis]